ncbi:MAG TPA: spermidine synthase, partial [Gammaproteobacteria bacterium]
MHSKLSLIFFLSGASALIFETLWFRLAGLSLGNSVWSVGLVLAAFMAGIALGNAAVARFGGRLARPVLVYAGLELVIGITGAAVVLALPHSSAVLGPALGNLADTPWLLNLVRLATGFVVLSIPAVAMGATLPVLTEALSRFDGNFGATLGRLYGWNTLGAMLGAIVSEVVLIRWFGIAASGLIALLLNFAAAVVALRISKATEPSEPSATAQPTPLTGLSLSTCRILAAAFLSGGILLALEVVWFRFLLLSHYGTSLVFAVMLAVVLAGIAAGGLVAARLYRANERCHAWLKQVAALSGVLVVLTYWGFDLFTNNQIASGTTTLEHVAFSLFLMFPVSLLSGIAFTMCGRAVKDELGASVKTTGVVTCANTVGAMLGSLLGAFVLLPVLGMEKSFFVLALGYGLVALVVPAQREAPSRLVSLSAHGSPALVLIALALFPFGLMQGSFLRVQQAWYPDHTLVETREGLTETASYYRYEKFGEPLYYRLITNGFSMSATNQYARRYMKLFVYLPMAFKPDTRDALLISYGVGMTAKALTNTEQLRHIDVVDISRDILEMNSIVYSDAENPLNDERVEVHVEDGRFFLNSAGRRYDLITSEPPPPTLAGVVNLYTQEYFELVRGSLNEGGYASYWLPVHQLEPLDTLAIIRAYCNAFPDCSLWSGTDEDWILMGSKDAAPNASLAQFTAQWNTPKVATELANLGVEQPAQLGALFMADAAQLAEITGLVPPVTDNYPSRISPRRTGQDVRIPLYEALMDEGERLARFSNSRYIDEFWPDQLKGPSQAAFSYEKIIGRYFAGPGYEN